MHFQAFGYVGQDDGKGIVEGFRIFVNRFEIVANNNRYTLSMQQ